MTKDHKIIPFPIQKPSPLENIRKELEKQGIKADIKEFDDVYDAIDFGILQILHIQNQMFDEMIHLIGETLPEDSGQSLVKGWRRKKRVIEEYIDQLTNMIEEEAFFDEYE